MKKNVIIISLSIILGAVLGILVYPKVFPPRKERKILYWTDSMIPGDRSDRPGKSPMGMERTPVYAGEGESGLPQATIQDEEYYTCPMHPSVHAVRPGACPVCGMALVKRSSRMRPSGVHASDSGGVSISPEQRVMANISTVLVERKTLRKEIHAVGLVTFAEPLQVTVAARFRGRIEKLYANYTGERVRQGQPLFALYSPTLVSAEREFLLSLEGTKGMEQAQSSLAGDMRPLLLQASRDRLRLLGLTQRQIDDLERTRQLQETVTVFSPISGTVIQKQVEAGQYVDEGMVLYQLADLSRVWAYVDVYEKDIRLVKIGQTVRLKTATYPGEQFIGQATFIDPTLNADTRTVRVRTEFANPRAQLKPNMYVEASIVIPVPDALVVPASSVLSTGKRSVVWVEVQENVFEARDVLIGTATEAYSQILGGLSGGEHVAETGGFLIDSESALIAPAPVDSSAMPVNEGRVGIRPPVRTLTRGSEVNTAGGVQEVRILVKGRYAPDLIRVKVGKPVRLHFFRDEDADCTSEVVFTDLNLRRSLPARETTSIEIVPREVGELEFTCGMGMIRGRLVVEK